MGKGKRYDTGAKLNKKKVAAVVIAIFVIIMFIIIINKLIKTTKEPGSASVVSYYPVYTNEKWGVINSLGNIVIEPTYDEIITIPDNKVGLFICTYDVDYTNNTYKTKVLDSKNKEKLKEYDIVQAVENQDTSNAMWYEENVLKVKKGEKYGLVNYSGKKILSVEYDSIEALPGIKNSFLINKEGKIGVCDNKGNIIINQEYKEIRGIQEDYRNGYIVIDQENKYGLIDFDKKVILPTKYEEIKSVIGDNIYIVKENGIYKAINKEGETLIENKFDDVKQINNEELIIIKDGKYGVINKNQEEKIPAKYEDLTYAFSNYYIAKKEDKYGIIQNDQEIIPFNYTNIIYRRQADIIELQEQNQPETKIMNNKFEEKLTGIITDLNQEKGYFRIRIGEDYKYYNFKFEERTKQEVLTQNNLFLSKKDGKYGYVDRNENVVVDYVYEDAQEQNQYGFAAVKKDGKWGAINSKAEVVAENKYELSQNIIIDFIGKWHLAEDINSNYYTDK